MYLRLGAHSAALPRARGRYGLGAHSAGLARARRQHLGLGMNPNQLGPREPIYRAPVIPITVAPTPVSTLGPGETSAVPRICPAWGCGAAPIRIVDSPGSAYTTPPASTSGTSAQTAGTPVPAGFNTNTPFIASDGSQWEFSASQNRWINVGTPYNLNTTGATTPTTTANAALYYPGSDVPATWPTSQVYTDASGVQWAYNSSTGQWQTFTSLYSAQGASSAAPAAAASSYYPGTSVPLGYPTNQAYTDSSGNVWQYNASTGQWQITTGGVSTATEAGSVLNWFSQNTLGATLGLGSIPNWIFAAAAGLVALKFSHPSTGRR